MPLNKKMVLVRVLQINHVTELLSDLADQAESLQGLMVIPLFKDNTTEVRWAGMRDELQVRGLMDYAQELVCRFYQDHRGDPPTYLHPTLR